MNSNRPRDKRRFLAPSAAISAFVFLVLMMMMIIIVMVTPKMTYEQLALFPFLSTNQEVLPTYISRIIPGAAFEGSLFHYYPEDIAIPAGTTIAWSNDDPGRPHTVTSSTPNGTSNILNSGLIPYNSFFQYTFDKAGTFDYLCTIHPWRTGTVTVSDAVERGHNFELRSGTGPILDLTEYNSTVINFKPITFTPQHTTSVTYNLSLLAPNTQEEVFSESFFVLDNHLQVELINDATLNGTQAYGPDITDPITGTYHVIGNLFETSGEYTIRVVAVAIGNTAPTERIVDEFGIQVVTT